MAMILPLAALLLGFSLSREPRINSCYHWPLERIEIVNANRRPDFIYLIHRVPCGTPGALEWDRIRWKVRETEQP